MTPVRTRVTVVGDGPQARSCCAAVEIAADLHLMGHITARVTSTQPSSDQVVKEVVRALEGRAKPQVAILAVPSVYVPLLVQAVLAQGISTVDGFDAHGDGLWSWRKELEELARAAQRVAITGAGWDPGANSLIRCVFSIMAPEGINQTRFYSHGTEPGGKPNGAGVIIERTGVPGQSTVASFRCALTASRQAVSGNVMAAGSRAAARLPAGAYTLAEIALVELLPGPREHNVRRMV